MLFITDELTLNHGNKMKMKKHGKLKIKVGKIDRPRFEPLNDERKTSLRLYAECGGCRFSSS